VITCASVKAAVAAHYGIPVATLDGKSRLAEFAHPRHLAMALSRQLIPCKVNQGGHISLTKIGYRFGNRDHSTVWSAIRQVALRRKSDPALRRSMRRLTVELLRGEE